MAQQLPSGEVTFAFTDVVGSTRAFTEHGQAYADALPPLQDTIAEVSGAHGGVVVKTEGDGAFLAFGSAAGAVRALREVQRRLEREPDEGLWLRIRAGAHTGPAEPINGDYLALAVHVAARVSSAAGAGQVLVSDAVLEALDADAERETGPVDVGTYELKDVREPMRLWRVAGDDSPPRATPARRTNVALPHTSFVGRDRELRELDQLLEGPGLVTIVGPGGVGKTRLVSEYAVRHAPDRADGIWMIELAPVTDPDEVLAAVALTLGLSGPPTLEAVASELARRGAPVLVLDNCEQVADAVADLAADLMSRHPTLSVVATSREPLEVHGERVHRLLSLAVSEPADAAIHAVPGPAEQLFLARAEAAGGHVSPDQLAEVAEICDLLDGLPLAVELAAPRTATMSARDLLAALREGDLQLRRRGGVQRQRSLELLVGWSLDLLDTSQRDALLVLSTFPGRFAGEMARHVLTGVDGLPHGAAAELTRRSLLDLDGEDYRMLVTVRDVVRTELFSRPQLHADAMDGLFGWALHACTQDAEQRGELTDQEALAVEEALAWALPERRSGCGHLLGALTAWALAHTPSQRAKRMAEDVMDAPAPTSADEVRLRAAAIRLVVGHAQSRPVSVEQVRELLEAARPYETEEPGAFSYAAHVAATVLARWGHLEEAMMLQQRMVDLADGRVEREVALTDLGVTHHLLGDLDQAERFYREALAISNPELPNHAVLMTNLGEALLDAGRWEEAATQLQATVLSTRGRLTLNAMALGLLVAAEAERGAVEVARLLARDAESELAAARRTDESVGYVLDRMKQALSKLPPPTD